MEARPDAATVAELLAMVRGMLDDERTRGQGLDAKSATLAGFTGTILALTTTLGAELLDLDLGSVGSAVFQCLYVVSVVALGVASLVALVGVLRPQPRLALAMDEIRRFSEFPLIATPIVEVQGTMMNTLIEALAHERALNERKARLTRVAAGRARRGLRGRGRAGGHARHHRLTCRRGWPVGGSLRVGRRHTARPSPTPSSEQDLRFAVRPVPHVAGAAGRGPRARAGLCDVAVPRDQHHQ